MAKPMRIDDHGFFAGRGSPLPPAESKVKQYSSADGAGKEMDYEDTTEEIKQAQDKTAAKIKAYPTKPNYRN